MSKIKRIDKILNKLNFAFEIYGTNLSFNDFSSFFDQKLNSCTFLEDPNEVSINRLKSCKASIILLSKTPSIIEVSKALPCFEVIPSASIFTNKE